MDAKREVTAGSDGPNIILSIDRMTDASFHTVNQANKAAAKVSNSKTVDGEASAVPTKKKSGRLKKVVDHDENIASKERERGAAAKKIDEDTDTREGSAR